MLKRVMRWAVRALVRVGAQWREIATGVAFLAGWALLTQGLAEQFPRVRVWWYSAGLFLWSLGGLGMLRDLVRHGLYHLWRIGRGG